MDRPAHASCSRRPAARMVTPYARITRSPPAAAAPRASCQLRTHAIRARPSGRARPRRPRRPTLPAPCRGRPARPRGTARSIPDLQALLLALDLGLAVHLVEQLGHLRVLDLRLEFGVVALDGGDPPLLLRADLGGTGR